MSTAISPLAPAQFPEMPPIAGVRLATAAAGIRYAGPHRRAAGAVRPRHDGGRRVHALEMPIRAGRLVPRASSKAARRARLWSIPATPTPSPARPDARPTKLTAGIAAAALGCKPSDVFLASTGVIGEPLDATKFGARHGSAGRQRRARRLARGGQGDHDHRHVSEGRDRHRAARHHATVTISGIAKGAGMIAPDMATMLVLRLHRRADRAPRAAEPARAGRRRYLQRGHHRRRYLDLGHAAGVRDRRRSRARRAEDRERIRSAAAGLPQGVRCRARQSRRAGRARRRGRAQAGRDHRRGRGVEALGAAHRAFDRQFAAGQDRDRRRGRQLGPRRDGGRQGRRAAPTATGSRSGSAASASPTKASATRPTTRLRCRRR